MTDTLLLLDTESDITASFEEAGVPRVQTQEEILSRYRTAEAGTRWVSEHSALDILGQALQKLHPSELEQGLLLFDRPDPRKHVRWQLFRTYFHTLIFADPDNNFLASEEIAEIMTSDTPSHYIIGGEVATEDEIVLLYRGTLEPLPVPFNFFRATGACRPDFTRFAVVDWGQTLQFGDYEATVESVLYDLDEKFRKAAKKNRIKQDNTFGGAFKRLRLLRGLTQSTFPGISEREIRRIEMNDVDPDKIHMETREILEHYLEVLFDEIQSY